MLVLGFDPARYLKDQINFKSFEFFSIVEDHDQQKQDSLFGLGLMPPPSSSMKPLKGSQQ